MKKFISIGIFPETKQRLREVGRYSDTLDRIINRALDALLREQAEEKETNTDPEING
jgi:hypothetical protein